LSPTSLSRKTALLCIGLGGLYSLAFAPDPLPSWSLPWVQVLAIGLLFHLTIRTSDPASAAKTGFLFGIGHFASGLYWLVISMHFYGGMPMPLAIVALFLFCGYLAIYPTLVCYIMKRSWPGGYPVRSKPVLWLAMTWASIWTLAEWTRAKLFTGFAWLQTAAGQVESWLSGWSSLIGPYGVCFLTAAVAAIVTITLANSSVQGGSKFNSKHALPILIAGILCAAGSILGQIRYVSPQGEPLIVRLVQGDLDQATKFSPTGFTQALELYQSLARHKSAQQEIDPDLILLPETVMIRFAHQIPPAVWRQWIDIANSHQGTLMMGGPLVGDQPGHYTNSVYAIEAHDDPELLAQGKFSGRYDKQHLVPFGEFVPWGFQWFVDWMNIPLGNFSAGQKQQQPIKIGDQLIAPHICYEDIFAEELLPAIKNNATILANFSNLGWFGNSVALRQHWQMARLRAMETQRPIVRSTNTGITGAIDETGTPIAMLPTMAAGYLDALIQGQAGMTPYARTGNWPILLVSLFFFVLAISGMTRKHSQSE